MARKLENGGNILAIVTRGNQWRPSGNLLPRATIYITKKIHHMRSAGARKVSAQVKSSDQVIFLSEKNSANTSIIREFK